MKKLLFGTAGIPISTLPRNTENGIATVKKLGLDAMELEFVYGVNITKEKAPKIKKIAHENNVILTCHAPYYINLNSLEKSKLAASKKRILDSARIANLCGVWSLTFHPGFYMKKDSQEVYDKIKKELKEVILKLKDDGINTWIRPETTGKQTQFGSLNEILKLSSEIENVMPCIDFAHVHARTKKYNSYEEFCRILESVENVLGKQGLKNIHAHVSGIEYGDRGERYHLTLKDSDFKYKQLVKALKEFKVRGVIISESPNIEKDALLLKNYFDLI